MLVGLLIKQFNMIATTQQYTKFGKAYVESITTTANNKTEILIEYEDRNDSAIYSAIPAIVNDDTDKRFDEILQSVYDAEPQEEPTKSPTSVNSYVSSEDSIKIYNVQTGEVIKCRPEDNVSSRYEADKSENDSDNEIQVAQDSRGDQSVEDTAAEELERSELEDILSQLPKVKELAKKFVMEGSDEPPKAPQPYSRRRRSKENILSDQTDKQTSKQYMHSLTARSISKEFREELKLSMATPLKVPGGAKESPDGDVIKESSTPGSPLPEPGTIKTKLAFFESLKTKFTK